MFQRFTDRAREVMALANQEAQRFNHECIGTEHILLGLVKEGTGVGAGILKSLEVDLREVRLEVEKLGHSHAKIEAMGKLPQSPRTKKVIEYAIEEARDLGHEYVGTEHILLGLVRDQQGTAAQILMNMGLEVDQIRKMALDVLGAAPASHSRANRLAEPKPPEPDLQMLLGLYITGADPAAREMAERKEELVRACDYEKAADLKDQLLYLAEMKQRAITSVIERDLTFASLIAAVAEQLPDDPATPGRLLLALLEANPELKKRLDPVMDEIRKACEGP